MNIESKLKKLNINLPNPPNPVGAYVAFKVIKNASLLIDMSKHKGEHPRMGATDVCPLIPVTNTNSLSSQPNVRFYRTTLVRPRRLSR